MSQTMQLSDTRFKPFTEVMPGWYLVGRYPEGDPDGVGSWLLAHNGESALIELPPTLCTDDVKTVLGITDSELKYVTASHEHGDHLDWSVWRSVALNLRPKNTIRPHRCGFRLLSLGGERFFILESPKHSATDCVIIFRGVAMMGDIELGTIETVNNEVPMMQRWKSFRFLRDFERDYGYRVHTVVSAHLNDFRTNVDWESLFPV